MKKEIVDGVTVYSDLFTDEQGRTWELLRRSGGSVSLYWTVPSMGGVYVEFDTIDKQDISDLAHQAFNSLSLYNEAFAVLSGAAAACGAAEITVLEVNPRTEGEVK